MMKKFPIILAVLITFAINCFSQSDFNNTIDRFKFDGYSDLRAFLSKNGVFQSDAFNTPGVLLAGLILEPNGAIKSVFALNSLSPEIDNSTLNLIESTSGHWLPDSTKNKNEIIIIPIVYCLKNTEHNLDTENFKLNVVAEIQLTAFQGGSQMSATNYQSTASLLKKFDKYISKSKNTDALTVIQELLRREPLNKDYYGELIFLENQIGNIEIACQNLKFVKAYLNIQPNEAKTEKVDCN